MDEQFPSLHDPEVKFMAEAPGMPVGVDFDSTRAEFAGEASLNPGSLKVGDILTINTQDSYTGEPVEVKLPVVEMRKPGVVRGDQIEKTAIVGYEGSKALVAGSAFSSIGRSGPLGITAGTYPILNVFKEGERPARQLLGRTIDFKVERPDAEGALQEVSLNALDRHEPYTSPNQHLISEGHKILDEAVKTILPGVELMAGVEGKATAGDKSIAFELKADVRTVKVLDRKTGKLNVVSAYPNGSVETWSTIVKADKIAGVDKYLDTPYGLADADATVTYVNFNGTREEIDGAVSVSLSPTESQALSLKNSSTGFWQTIYKDGSSSFDYDGNKILETHNGKPVLMTKPPRTIDPVKSATDVMKVTAAALRDYAKVAKSKPDSITGKLNRRNGDILAGGTLEQLEIPKPAKVEGRIQRLRQAVGSALVKKQSS